MPVRMMSNIPGRVIQVLKDHLPAELDLIDTEEADGITTPNIGTNDYHEWDRQNIIGLPACSIRVVSSEEIETGAVGSGGSLGHSYGFHRLDVMFHVAIQDANTAQKMQDHLFRYIAGAMRVLCLKKEGLQTTADPTRYAETTVRAGPATYGPVGGQEDGAVVRTATLPISVRMSENL